MSFLKKRSSGYYIGFKRTVDGKQQERMFSLGTKRVNTAKSLKTRIDTALEAGEINPFGQWNAKTWLNNLGRSEQDGPRILKKAIEHFIDSLNHVRPRTIQVYKDVLNRFSGEIGDTMPLEFLTQKDIKDFCFRKKLSPASQNSYLRTLKRFFIWAEDEELMTFNPVRKIKRVPEDDDLKDQIISEKQLKLIIAKQEKIIQGFKETGSIATKGQEQLWFRPLMATFFYSGIRAQEALDMTWGDVDLEEDYMTVTGKGGRQRTVVIFSPLKPYLMDWKNKVPSNPDNLVFPSAKSDTIQIKMTVNAVSKTFRHYRKKAKLPDTIHLHSLRHSCATFMLRKGFGLMEVHNMLGHRTLEVTKRYTHLVPADIRERARKLKI